LKKPSQTEFSLQFYFKARQIPFRISFKTDADEATVGTIATSDTNEAAVDPRGTIGFSLRYVEQTC
jgi:hypothetical protein